MGMGARCRRKLRDADDIGGYGRTVSTLCRRTGGYEDGGEGTKTNGKRCRGYRNDKEEREVIKTNVGVN